MSIKKEANGRRSVQIEVEVHGTPEEVWKAIATGPGISSWFVPTEFEERDGKPVSMKLSFGPGMEIRTDLTAWEPPVMFATEAGHPGSPAIANEWIVEARGEGVCVIRIVQSLFASTDDWDDQLESAKTGLASFLSILQIYLKHFRGQSSTVMKWMAPFAGTDAKAWESLTMTLGLKDLVVGQRMSPTAGVPSLSGVVEYLTLNPYDAVIRLDQPGAGVAAIGTFSMGGPSIVALNLYLYGDTAAKVAAKESPLWDVWFQKHFPTESEVADNTV